MNLATRLRGAWRLLVRRGDEATTCSFCGLGRRHVELVIAGPAAVAICHRCVFTCNAVLLQHQGPQQFRRRAEGAHQRAVGIQLSHEATALDAAEKAALEPLLAVLAASLPDCRLLGWSFHHGLDRFDMLTVELATASDLPADDLRKLANERWGRMRDAWLGARNMPANAAAPELVDLGADALAACTRYAAGVSAAGDGATRRLHPPRTDADGSTES